MTAVPAAATLDPRVADSIGWRGRLTRAALEAHQLAALKATLAHASCHSPFYRTRGDWPDGLPDRLADIARYPFTTPEDLMRADPPLLAASQADVARIVTLPTSGTTGASKRVFFTAEDMERTLDFFADGMGLMARPGDRVAVLFPAGRPGSVGDCLFAALTRIGALPQLLPLDVPVADLVARLVALDPQVVAGPPVRILAAARFMAAAGGAQIRPRAVLLSSDRTAPALRAAVEGLWSTEVYDHWGMTETGLGGAVECVAHDGGHIREADLLVEVVDPVTGAPRAPGETGEIVFTTLRRRAMPLVRYRSGDLGMLDNSPCRCGSVLARLRISGRIGAGSLLPGGDLTLSRLDDLLFALPFVSDFAATLVEGHPARLRVVVAVPAPLRSTARVAEVNAVLAADGLVGPAIASGALELRVTLDQADVCSHSGKRKLIVARRSEPVVAA